MNNQGSNNNVQGTFQRGKVLGVNFIIDDKVEVNMLGWIKKWDTSIFFPREYGSLIA